MELTPIEMMNEHSRRHAAKHIAAKLKGDSGKQRDRWIALWMKRLECPHPAIRNLRYNGFNEIYTCHDCGATVPA